MEIKKLSKTAKIVNKIYNYISQRNYGEFISYKEIEELIKIPYIEQRFNIYVRCAKKRLIKDSKILKGIPGRGYQILKPTQVSSFVYRTHIQKMLKAYENSEKILDYLDINNFNEDRIEEYNNISKLNKTLKETTTNTIKESKYYSRKDYYDSLKED